MVVVEMVVILRERERGVGGAGVGAYLGFFSHSPVLAQKPHFLFKSLGGVVRRACCCRCCWPVVTPADHAMVTNVTHNPLMARSSLSVQKGSLWPDAGETYAFHKLDYLTQ